MPTKSRVLGRTGIVLALTLAASALPRVASAQGCTTPHDADDWRVQMEKAKAKQAPLQLFVCHFRSYMWWPKPLQAPFTRTKEAAQEEFLREYIGLASTLLNTPDLNEKGRLATVSNALWAGRFYVACYYAWDDPPDLCDWEPSPNTANSRREVLKRVAMAGTFRDTLYIARLDIAELTDILEAYSHIDCRTSSGGLPPAFLGLWGDLNRVFASRRPGRPKPLPMSESRLKECEGTA
jgi:hypothetical protein